MHLTPNISYPLMIDRFHADASGYDCALLHGHLPDGADRFSADCGFVLVHLRLLSLRAAGALSEILAEINRFPAHADGCRSGAYCQQCKGCYGSHLGIQTSFARTAKFGYRRSAEATSKLAATVLQTPERLAALRGTRHRQLFCLHGLFAIDTMNYLALPFLLLFVCGYFWAGLPRFTRNTATSWNGSEPKKPFRRASEQWPSLRAAEYALSLNRLTKTALSVS